MDLARATLAKTDPEPEMEYTQPKTMLELEIERLKRANRWLAYELIDMKLEQIENGLNGIRRYFETI